MQLDNLLRAADPARQAQPEDADSPRATALYRRIVSTSPSRGGGGVRTSEVRRGLRAPWAPATQRTASPGGRPTARRRNALIAGATVVMVAAGISLIGLAGGFQQPHTTSAASGQTKLAPRQPARSLPPAAPSSAAHSPALASPAVPKRLNEAAGVLDALAAVAAGGQATSPDAAHGKYLYVLDIELKGAPPGGGASMPCGSVIRQEWLARNGSGRQVGSEPGCSTQKGFTQKWSRIGNNVNFSYFAWRGLPTTPAALEAAIVKRFEGGTANNAVTFLIATSILNVAAPPSMRAAVFKMLATLPHVQYLGKVTDPLKRTGDTIGLVQQPDDLVAMFDPQTGQVLDALLVPYGTDLTGTLPPWAAPTMYVKTAMVGSDTRTPPGVKKLLSEIPYQQWVS